MKRTAKIHFSWLDNETLAFLSACLSRTLDGEEEENYQLENAIDATWIALGKRVGVDESYALVDDAEQAMKHMALRHNARYAESRHSTAVDEEE